MSTAGSSLGSCPSPMRRNGTSTLCKAGHGPKICMLHQFSPGRSCAYYYCWAYQFQTLLSLYLRGSRLALVCPADAKNHENGVFVCSHFYSGKCACCVCRTGWNLHLPLCRSGAAISVGITLLTFWAASVTDPGYIDSSNLQQHLNVYGQKAQADSKFCMTCSHLRPARSKHCRLCNRFVQHLFLSEKTHI